MPRTADDAAYLANSRTIRRWRSRRPTAPCGRCWACARGWGWPGPGPARKAGFLDAIRITAGSRPRGSSRGRWPMRGPGRRASRIPDGGEAGSIDAWLVRQPSHTVLIPVTGDSMIEAGIQPGDRVVVERDVPARPGDLVIAVIDNEFTLKTLAVEDGEAVLVPANPAYPVLRPGDRLQVFGVVVGFIRSYRR